MKIAYRARHILEASIVEGMLKAQGIAAHSGGYYLQGAVGELAVDQFAVVYVEDADFAAARQLVAAYEAGEAAVDAGLNVEPPDGDDLDGAQ
jgi:hypothetical protein